MRNTAMKSVGISVMHIRNYVPALAVAGLGALAIVMAPAAAAAPSGSGGTSEPPGFTQTSPNSTLHQTNGSSQLHSSPPTVSPPQSYSPGLFFRR
jgi:hypothetical protein